MTERLIHHRSAMFVLWSVSFTSSDCVDVESCCQSVEPVCQSMCTLPQAHVILLNLLLVSSTVCHDDAHRNHHNKKGLQASRGLAFLCMHLSVLFTAAVAACTRAFTSMSSKLPAGSNKHFCVFSLIRPKKTIERFQIYVCDVSDSKQNFGKCFISCIGK